MPQVLKKHGCFKGLLVISNIPLAKIILNQIFKKRLLLLQKKIEKDVINDIPKVDGGILNSKESVKILNDIQPDIEINTIRDYYTNMNPYCGPLPLPNDSSTYVDLDLDGDSENDFRIQINHYEPEINEYCGHC